MVSLELPKAEIGRVEGVIGKFQFSSDSKVHGVDMGPIWGWHDPGGPHIVPMNFTNWGSLKYITEFIVIFVEFDVFMQFAKIMKITKNAILPLISISLTVRILLRIVDSILGITSSNSDNIRIISAGHPVHIGHQKRTELGGYQSYRLQSPIRTKRVLWGFAGWTILLMPCCWFYFPVFFYSELLFPIYRNIKEIRNLWLLIYGHLFIEIPV